LFVEKNNWEKDFRPFNWREDFNQDITFFFFETICKKNIYNINHYVGIVKTNPIFFPITHYTVDASNQMPHLNCCACLMLVRKYVILTWRN
jgi:hypothetical protein